MLSTLTELPAICTAHPTNHT